MPTAGALPETKPAPAGPPVYHVWNDAEGEPVDCKVRQLMSNGRKEMRWEHIENGQWKAGQSAKELRPPLYRLDALRAAPSTEVIHFAEGEKCVDTLCGRAMA